MSTQLAKFHESVAQTLVAVVKSTLSNNVSSHTLPPNVSLKSISLFQNHALAHGLEQNSYIGTVGGDLCVSIKTAAGKRDVSYNKGTRKRKADVEAEEAERAVDRVRRSVDEESEKLNDSVFCTAIQTATDVLKLRGASGESCLEAWAVSHRKPGEYGADSQANCGGLGNIVVAARISGGVALRLHSFVNAFGRCKDGMLTTSTESVSKDFDLPMSEQAIVAQEQGQLSILVLATVPPKAAVVEQFS